MQAQKQEHAHVQAQEQEQGQAQEQTAKSVKIHAMSQKTTSNQSQILEVCVETTSVLDTLGARKKCG